MVGWLALLIMAFIVLVVVWVLKRLVLLIPTTLIALLVLGVSGSLMLSFIAFLGTLFLLRVLI